jgi:hypothetical protein
MDTLKSSRSTIPKRMGDLTHERRVSEGATMPNATGSPTAGNRVVIGTPNALCVVPMWSLDTGHIQQYPLADLAADLVVRGFQVEAFRVWHGPWSKGIRRRLRLFAMRGLCYLLAVDYAHGIVVIGKKKTPA